MEPYEEYNQINNVEPVIQLAKKKKKWDWKVFFIVLLSALLVTAVSLYLFIFRYDRIEYYDGVYDPFSEEGGYFDPSCNIAGINIHGDLLTVASEEDERYGATSAEDVLSDLWAAEQDENIKAIILEVDSSGGFPVAGEEIYKAVRDLKKPVIAFVRQSGLSAAYFAIASADKIFASALSDVGSIGVTMSYIDSSKYNKENGFTYNEISSGKYKNSGSEEKELTKEEKEMFQRDVDIIYEHFIKYVSAGRNLSIDEVRTLADGSSMLGEMALEKGLIDKIGNYSDVKKYIGDKYDIEPEVCW